ncbi:antibiotic biosynthesis monooxygenase [Planotetraspora thailandica]|uniref:Antibiotic biosynthesis monooxygenase n=1 Tax=Planotetraspora thailandica TaxID=487172 RepID=A0A8J3V3S3_9ACTN|nr:antibiotic biosynthesis monooxygenase [Planotetraspora thailandica]GII56243.1 antibiotic biosynthesis monooxygenase [Planotetraspora thailandica]
MIIVSGKLYVDPAARQDYLAGCRAVIEQARTTPGCLDFALSPDSIEPGRINVYEHWESAVHLERFRGSGPEPDQVAAIRDAQVAEYRVSL